MQSTPHRGLSFAALGAAALLLVACGVDGEDAYTAGADAPVETRAPRDEPVDGEHDGAGEGSAADGAAEAPPVAAAPNGEVVEVRSIDNTFRAATIEVVAGTEVKWVNGGRNEHDVEPVEEDQDWGVAKEDFEPGDEYSHVFGVAGTYDYYCTLHATTDAGMIGTVVVLPVES